jgi:flagellar motility protein MotE (MotC chaperone)
MNARSKARVPGTDGGGAFITQRNEKISEIKKEIEDLEALLGSTAPTSQSTLLLKKRKELREVDESLAAVKQDYKKRLEECEERRVGFVNRQARQRDNVIKFEKFIQENESKRKRAEERLRSEVKDYEDYCRVLAKGDAQLAEIDAERNKLLTQLGRVSVYKAFLEKIVEEGEYGYDSPDLILDRYRNLKEVNIDLTEKANASDEELQERTKQFQLLRIESENQVLASKGILTKYQKELKAITLDVKREQNEKDYVEEKKKDLSREYSQVTQSIRNLYVRCQGKYSIASSSLT